MKKIKLTQGKYTVVDAEDFELANKIKWHFDGSYAANKSPKKLYLHRLITNAPVNLEVDHINRNKLDNRKSNLRLVGRDANALNIGVRIDNKLQVQGVIWRADRSKFYAYFRGKYIGYFKTIKEAIIARKNAEQIYDINVRVS